MGASWVIHLIMPGSIISKNDGDRHYITATQLAKLYGVNLNDWNAYIFDRAKGKEVGITSVSEWVLSHGLSNRPIKLLAPRFDGHYDLSEITPITFPFQSAMDLVAKQFPVLVTTDVRCPDKKSKYCPQSSDDAMNLLNMIIHLNDYCGWTRERIADWLDTLDVDLKFGADT